jgi:neutral ceramidase
MSHRVSEIDKIRSNCMHYRACRLEDNFQGSPLDRNSLMKNLQIFVMFVFPLGLVAPTTCEAAEVAAWSFGYAEADITPASGKAMMGGFGRERYSKGTLDPLRAQALAIKDSQGKTVLLLTADVLGFGRVSVDAMRWKLHAKHDLPVDAICFSASHTHWGPAINFQTNFAIGGMNVWYIGWLENTLLELAESALSDLSPATISYGECEMRIGMNRRLPSGNGEIRMAPNPDGSYDAHTPVVRITRAESPKLVVLVGHACHPTSMGSIERWSADYPGAMRDKLEASFDDCRAVFVMGCGGDAKVLAQDAAEGQYAFASAPEQGRAAGIKLANGVMEVLQQSMDELSPELHTTIVQGSLSLQPPKSRAEIEAMAFEGNSRDHTTWWARQSLAYPDDRRKQHYEVQSWRLGELTLVALEGEVCADWGERVRSAATTPHAMVIAYANHVPGYIPTAQIIHDGGYEGYSSHMAYFLPAPFDPVMEEELSSLVSRSMHRGASE